MTSSLCWTRCNTFVRLDTSAEWGAGRIFEGSRNFVGRIDCLRGATTDRGCGQCGRNNPHEGRSNDTIRRSRASVPPRNPRTRAPSLRRLHSIALTPAGRVPSLSSGLFRPHCRIPNSSGSHDAASLAENRDGCIADPKPACPAAAAGQRRSFATAPRPAAGSRVLCGCRRAAPQPTCRSRTPHTDPPRTFAITIARSRSTRCLWNK